MLFPFPFWDARDADTFGTSTRRRGRRRGLAPGAVLHVLLVRRRRALRRRDARRARRRRRRAVPGNLRNGRGVRRGGHARPARHLFEIASCPTPRIVAVTRWGADPFARGSYSNISPRGTGTTTTRSPSPWRRRSSSPARPRRGRTRRPCTARSSQGTERRRACTPRSRKEGKRGKQPETRENAGRSGTGDAWARAPAGKKRRRTKAFFENAAGRVGEWRDA